MKTSHLGMNVPKSLTLCILVSLWVISHALQEEPSSLMVGQAIDLSSTSLLWSVYSFICGWSIDFDITVILAMQAKM